MFKKILVPLDGSPTAETALPRALELADRVGGTLHVVTVARAGPAAGPGRPKGRPPSSAVDRTDLVRAAEAYLDDVGGRIAARSSEVEITGQVLPAANGSVVPALLHEITAEGVDLVVMTTHGRGPHERAWLGSVADGMTRQSARPVLLLRSQGDGSEDRPDALETEAPPFRHILVPLDGSIDAEEALGFAREMARTEEARVSLIAVVPGRAGDGAAYPTMPGQGDEPGVEERLSAAREGLEETAAGLQEEGIEVSVEVVHGDHPGSAIIEAAERSGADLIAMTTRGRGGVPRLLLGRVVDKVVRGASLPVLVHRPRRRDEE